MPSSHKGSGLVIKKRKLLNGQVMLTIFSKESGKLVMSAFGIKKLTSKRLSHFEVGNYISYTYGEKGDFLTIRETELQYGHTKIKSDDKRLQMMFHVFFILNKLLPENQEEDEVFEETLKFLRKMNKESVSVKEFEAYVAKILLALGYLDPDRLDDPLFDIYKHIESIIGQKVDLHIH